MATAARSKAVAQSPSRWAGGPDLGHPLNQDLPEAFIHSVGAVTAMGLSRRGTGPMQVTEEECGPDRVTSEFLPFSLVLPTS